MNLNRLLSYTRKAVDKYNMIDEDDKIAVGISGGKDSLALLYALAELRKFYPVRFDITAITVNLGIEPMDYSKISKLCCELDVDYYIIDTQIKEIVFDIRKEKHPCSLCAKLRKGALNNKIKELGCNKVAYGHHRDDFVETLYMSLIYEGRLHTLSPITYLEKSGLTLIRPLLFVPEVDIIGFKNKYSLPVLENLCPADGNTKRQEIKNIIKELKKANPCILKNGFSAIQGADFKDWPKIVNL